MSGYNATNPRNTDRAPQSALSAQTVAFSHYNNLSAQLPIDPATGKLVGGGVAVQATQCMENLKAVIESIGHVMDDVVRLTIFVTKADAIETAEAASAAYFGSYVPARTSVAVAALPLGASVQIEALLSNGEGSIPDAPQAGDLIKLVRNAHKLPASRRSTHNVAFSHYSNVTAQLPADAAGALVAGGAQEQAEQCLNNIKSVLWSMCHELDDVVRITVFLTDLADIEAVNAVYPAFFPGYRPARTVVKAEGLPLGADVMIEAVVSHGDGTPPQLMRDTAGLVKYANNTDAAPRDEWSTQTVAFSHYNHISAQLPVDASGNAVGGGAREQAAQCLANIKAIVESIGHSLDDAVKMNLALTDLADLGAVDEAYAAAFPGYRPARRVIGVSALPGGARVQIDAVLGNAEGTPPAA